MGMEEEIRENAGDRMQDNISNIEGTKKWGNLQNNADGTGSGSADQGAGEQPQQEFPRASEEEVMEAAERAKAKFGGTYGGGGGVETDADEAIAAGEKPGPFQNKDSGGSSGSAEGDQSASEAAAAATSDTPVEENQEAGGDELTTSQKMAGIMSSDPNMQWEAKITDKLSGGDDENTSGI